MEDAKTLIRMAARAFYGKAGVRLILIIDALAIHSTLPNEDLSILLGIQQKDLRKLCGRLREDRMISVHSRQETREGMLRPIHRDWYFMNFYLTIDAIKFRVMHLTNRVKDQFKPSEEKKDYFCPRCKAEWTQMEVLSSVSDMGEFLCQKCSFALERHETSEADRAGHERLSRLMSQLDPLIKMLRRIDEQNIPQNDFETAESLRVPIYRDENLNPSRRLEPVKQGNLPGLRGLKQESGPAVEVSLVDPNDEERQRREAAKRQEAQNALPEWHTTSTVTGEMTALGLKEAERTGTSANGLSVKPEADEAETKEEEGEDDKKKPSIATPSADPDTGVDQSMMDAYLAQLREEQALKAQQPPSDVDEDDDDEEEEEEEEEEEDNDDDDFEDVVPGAGTSSSRPGTPASSVGGSQPPQQPPSLLSIPPVPNGLGAPFGPSSRSNGSASFSSPLKRAASLDSDSATPGTSAAPTPNDDRGRSPAKRVRVENTLAAEAQQQQPPLPQLTDANGADSEDDEEFEDAL